MRVARAFMDGARLPISVRSTATSRTLPFGFLPLRISASVALFMTSSASATAIRWVAGLALTSTIRAAPSGPT